MFNNIKDLQRLKSGGSNGLSQNLNHPRHLWSRAKWGWKSISYNLEETFVPRLALHYAVIVWCTGVCSHCVSPQYVEYKVFNWLADYYQLKCLTFTSITHFRRVAWRVAHFSFSHWIPQGPQTSDCHNKSTQKIFLTSKSNIFRG